MQIRRACRAIIVSSLFAVSCAASSPAHAKSCEVKIGTVSPLSGGASAWGISYKDGTDFIAASINAAGGLKLGNRRCKIKVTSYDSHYQAAGGAAAASFFAGHGIHAVVGPVGSPVTEGFRPVAKRDDIVDFSSSYMSDVISRKWPLVFHSLQGPEVVGPALIKAAQKHFKFHSVVVLSPNDLTNLADQLSDLYKSAGYNVTLQYFQRGTTNFAPLARRLMNEHPDLIEIGDLGPGDVQLIVKQLEQAGYNGIFGAIGGVGLKPVKEGAGGIKNIKGYFWLELMPVDSKGARKFRADYRKITKSAPPNNGLLYVGANAAEQLLKAISIAGTDANGRKIAAALRNMTPHSRYFGQEGWRGMSQYGINQELAFPIGMGVVSDGKLLGVKEVNIPSEK